MQMHLLVLSIALVALPALGQPPSASAVRAESRTVSSVPPYRSAFANYRAWREPELMDWRRANDEVGAAGGHMGHVRGQAGEGAMPASIATPAAKPEPAK